MNKTESKSFKPKADIQFYPNGHPCHSCLWIQEDKELSHKYNWGLMKPIYVIQPDMKTGFVGVSIFNSQHVFKNSFNVVNGVKGGSSAQYHQSHLIGSNLRGATMFIEALNTRFGIKTARLLINSNFNMKKHGKKEHVHSIITLSDEDAIRVFPKIATGEKLFSKKKLTTITGSPYPEDTVINLSTDQSKELIRAGKKAVFMVADLVSEKLGRKIDISTDNFYIFLTFNCEDNTVPRCGVVKGMISTDSKA